MLTDFWSITYLGILFGADCKLFRSSLTRFILVDVDVGWEGDEDADEDGGWVFLLTRFWDDVDLFMAGSFDDDDNDVSFVVADVRLDSDVVWFNGLDWDDTPVWIELNCMKKFTYIFGKIKNNNRNIKDSYPLDLFKLELFVFKGFVLVDEGGMDVFLLLLLLLLFKNCCFIWFVSLDVDWSLLFMFCPLLLFILSGRWCCCCGNCLLLNGGWCWCGFCDGPPLPFWIGLDGWCECGCADAGLFVWLIFTICCWWAPLKF
jgi:hypothetical protein